MSAHLGHIPKEPEEQETIRTETGSGTGTGKGLGRWHISLPRRMIENQRTERRRKIGTTQKMSLGTR